MRLRRPLVGLLGAVALGAAAVAPAEASPGGPSAVVRAMPAASRFGDAFVYEATVTVSAGDDAVVLVDPSPFTALGPATTTRRTRGGSAIVTVRQRVACLALGCLPGAAPRTVTTGLVRLRRGATTSVVPGSTTQVTVSGRVPTAVVERGDGGYRTDTAVPAQTFDLSPAVLTALLVAASIVALLLAAALLWPDARARRRSRQPAGDADPFARAVRLLRESAHRGPTDRRRAADLVARVVGRGGDPARARAATRLAWSRPEPAPAEAVGLADAVERGEEAR